MPALQELLDSVGLDGPALAGSTTIAGHDPIMATPWPVGEVAATALAGCGAAAAHLWKLRTGREQEVSVDVGAAAASLVSFALQSFLQGPTPARAEGRPLVELYECGDQRWIHLHGSFPKLAEPTRRVLDLTEAQAEDSAEVATAVARWKAQELEDALAAAGTCGAMVRSPAEWAAHPQGQAVAGLGPVAVTRIGDSPAVPVGDGSRPLGGVRVLDLTRVLAGPACGRTLAAHGADVLLINSPKLPNVPPFVLDTSHGKRSAFADLATADGRRCLNGLLAGADVFAQGYRGGALERKGFGVDDVVAARPGIVYVTINCYGDVGPWRSRPGWEQLAQSVSGIAAVQGGDGPPQRIPAAACDYTTGYLAALGTMAALARRATEGGSYLVQASLCQTAGWIVDQGARCDPAAATGLGGVTGWLVESDTAEGRLRHLGPVVQMTATPPRWDRPSPPLGADPAVWV